jgi:hypothetical protein
VRRDQQAGDTSQNPQHRNLLPHLTKIRRIRDLFYSGGGSLCAMMFFERQRRPVRSSTSTAFPASSEHSIDESPEHN